MLKSKPLGDQELEALRYAAANAPISVGEMAKEYGAPRGLARTTVLTVMERLRIKGYLTRQQVDGVFQYAPKHDHVEVMSGVVAEFVQRSLGGSLSPFVTYLSNSGKLSTSEVEELKKLVERLESEEKGK
jgi:predicted transcriptional regulator